LYLNGLSFLAVIGALLWIKVKKGVVDKSDSVAKDLKEGLRFMRGNRLISALLSLVDAVSLFGMSYVILMPVFANDVLHAGVKGLGLLMSSAGLGALAGALILARLGNFKYKGKLLISSAYLFSAWLIILALSKSYFLSVISLIFVGATSVMAIALVNTFLQTNVPDKFRGRVMSLFMITFAGITPFGNLISGTLAQLLGVSMALLASGAVCAGLFLLINLLFPELSEL